MTTCRGSLSSRKPTNLRTPSHEGAGCSIKWTTLYSTPCPVSSCPAYEPNSGSIFPKPINKSLIASRGADIVMQSSGENRGQPYTPVNYELAFIHVILCSSRSKAQSWNHSRWRVGSYTDGCTAGGVDFDRFETYDARQAERQVRLVSYIR